jgi:hypothetical protein
MQTVRLGIYSATARPLVMLLLASTALSQPATTQTPSSESGTLVMAARTADAVMISVDSRIVQNPGGGLPETTKTAAEDKLIDVGQTSTCAIAGFLGGPNNSSEVSASLRAWVGDHPKAEAHDAIEGLLEEAEKVWNTYNYNFQQLPGDRQPVDGISATVLTCGEIADGRPTIVRGETYVHPVGFGDHQIALHRQLQPMLGDFLYLDGDLHTEDFALMVSNPSELRLVDASGARRKDYELFLSQVGSDIAADPTTMSAFQILVNANRESAMNRYTGKTSVPDSIFSQLWTHEVVRDLFIGVFASVEKHTNDVGGPNNVRVIKSCGRLISTIEKVWPTCPTSLLQKNRMNPIVY